MGEETSVLSHKKKNIFRTSQSREVVNNNSFTHEEEESCFCSLFQYILCKQGNESGVFMKTVLVRKSQNYRDTESNEVVECFSVFSSFPPIVIRSLFSAIQAHGLGFAGVDVKTLCNPRQHLVYRILQTILVFSFGCDAVAIHSRDLRRRHSL